MLALLPLLLPSLSSLQQDPVLVILRQGSAEATPLLSPAGRKERVRLKKG